MPSRAKRRTRRKARKPLPWGVILWLASIISFCIGLGLSPATAPKKWQLESVRDSDLAHIERVLERYVETPWIRVPGGDIQAELVSRNAIESVRVSVNIFGRGQCVVRYRTKVLRVGKPDSVLFMDSHGTVFRDTDKSPPDLIRLELPVEFLSHHGSIAGDWSSGDLLLTQRFLKESVPNLAYTLAMDDQTVISLRVQDGPTVIIGSGNKLREKVTVLSRIVMEQPETFRRSKEINLMSPDNPTVSP